MDLSAVRYICSDVTVISGGSSSPWVIAGSDAALSFGSLRSEGSFDSPALGAESVEISMVKYSSWSQDVMFCHTWCYLQFVDCLHVSFNVQYHWNAISSNLKKLIIF